jgi:hypothetical protein
MLTIIAYFLLGSFLFYIVVDQAETEWGFRHFLFVVLFWPVFYIIIYYFVIKQKSTESIVLICLTLLILYVIYNVSVKLAVNKKTSTKVRAKARVKQDLTKSPTQLRAETKAPKRKDLTKRQWERYGELIRILRNNKTKYARELSLSEAENMYMQMKLDEMKRIKTKYAGIV